jgi:hypothetical protein
MWSHRKTVAVIVGVWHEFKTRSQLRHSGPAAKARQKPGKSQAKARQKPSSVIFSVGMVEKFSCNFP